MKRVSMTGLRAFERVVATGSQREAGEELGVTQTAISHAIRSLEDHLGASLFHRQGGTSSLTRTGNDLAAELGPAFARIDRVVERLMGESHVVTLSVTPAFAACWLAPQLAQYAADGKTLPLQIHATTDIVPLSYNGVSMAVRYSAQAEGAHLGCETFQAVVSQSAGVSEGFPTGLPLLETRWSRGQSFAPTWSSWFEASGNPAPASARMVLFDDEHHAMQAALTGAGVALVSSVLAAPLLEQGLLRIVRPDVKIKGLSYWLLVDPDRASERSVVAISNWIRLRFSKQGQSDEAMMS